MSVSDIAIVTHGRFTIRSRSYELDIGDRGIRYRMWNQSVRYTMSDCDDLWHRVRISPGSLRFREAEKLAMCFGFVMVRQRGSHRIYKAPGVRELVNLQEREKMAKPYQVRQLVKLIDAYGLAERGEDDDTDR